MKDITAYRLYGIIIIYRNLNTIEIDDPVDAIELGEWLVQTGKQMIQEQTHK